MTCRHAADISGILAHEMKTPLMFVTFLVFTLFAMYAGVAHAQPKGELIFEPSSVSFASSHASTIVQLKNGALLAAWFGGC